MSLENFIIENFKAGVVRFNLETHVTPHGIVKGLILSNKLGYRDELEIIINENSVKIIENQYAKD